MTLDENDRKVNAEGADVSNWRTPPFNGWAFHNVREIIPTADIEAAPGRALVFPETPLSLSDRLDWGGAVGSSLDLHGFLKAAATGAAGHVAPGPHRLRTRNARRTS